MKKNKVKIDKNQEVGMIDEKNEQLVKVKAFSISKFIIKLFAAAILITFAVLIFINEEEAQFAVVLISGSICGIAAMIRVIPLLKTLETPQARIVSFIEILVHLGLAGILISASFISLNNPLDKYSLFVYDYFQLFIAAILYTRALCYFWITVLYKEKTTKFNFWLHIIAITLAVLFAALNNLSAYHIAIAIAVISLISALYIVVEAGGGYLKYRKAILKAKKKEEQYHKEDVIAPGKDDKIINEINPSIIPVDDNNIDSTIIS